MNLEPRTSNFEPSNLERRETPREGMASVGWGNINNQHPTLNIEQWWPENWRRSFTSGMAGAVPSWGGRSEPDWRTTCEHSRAGGCHLSIA